MNGGYVWKLSHVIEDNGTVIEAIEPLSGLPLVAPTSLHVLKHLSTDY